MLIDLKEISPVRKSVEVEIPATDVNAELAHVTTDFSRQAKVPGFRPGKTPANVVRQRFAKEIEQEVIQRLLPRFFSSAVEGKDFETVGDPHLTRVDALEDGKPVRFSAEFEVKPAFELRDYRGLRATETFKEVTPADLEATVERLLDQAAAMRPVSDRPAQEGDYLVIDVASSGTEIESRRSEGYQFQLGKDAPLPELSESLIGRSPGEQVSFDKSYGEDAPNEEVRGKTVHYEVTLREIRLREKPELTDEFAKSIGLTETVEELREKLGNDLRAHREHEALNGKKKEIGDQLLTLHQMEVPESMVEEELGKSMRSYARFLESQGVDLEKAEIDWMKMREEFLPEASKRVKRMLILEAIARKENIQISDTEVDAEIRKACRDAQKEFAEVRHRLKHDGGYEALRGSIAQEKALEFLLDAAIVTPQT